jgi:hypothetical protein
MKLVRIIEKLLGVPHQYQNADRVKDAVASLSHDVRRLNDTLKPYAEADDPLVALMTDVFNDRQLQNGNLKKKYNGNGK